MAAFELKLSIPMMKFSSRLLVLAALALPSLVLAPHILVPSAKAQQAAYVDDRLNQLQQSLTVLTGQLEQLQYSN